MQAIPVALAGQALPPAQRPNRSVQETIDAAPRGNSQPYEIRIQPGTYTERITIPKDNPFIRLVGEDAARTILTYNLSSATTTDTPYTASTYVFASDFTAENITFENTYGTGSQAVALFVFDLRNQ